MIKNSFLLLTLLVISRVAICQQDSAYILNENFDRNRLGWVEEFTSSHSMGLKDGFLFIISKDTSKERTSNPCRNTYFLLDMPDKFEISSCIYRLKGKMQASYGLILESGTLTYKFSFTDEGNAELSEEDANKEEPLHIFSRKTKFSRDGNPDSVVFRIVLAQRNYSYYLNDELVSTGELKAKSWADLRPFVSSGSGIKVDYLRIKEVK